MIIISIYAVRIFGMSQENIALITGSSQGLGFELAKILDQSGMRIILTGRDINKLDKAYNQLSQQKKHLVLPGDLTCTNHLNKMIAALKEQEIYPNFIIHNLGNHDPNDIFPLKPDVLRRTMQVHLDVALILNEAFLSRMMDNQFGRIIHISSDSSLTGKCSPAYAATKSAINGYVKSAARYYAKHNIMFCAVLPNIFEHENSAWTKKKKSNPSYYQERLSQMPTGRFAHPTEIAKYVADIACNKSIMSAGSLIELTGGY